MLGVELSASLPAIIRYNLPTIRGEETRFLILSICACLIMLNFSWTNYSDLKVPLTNIHHFPLIATKSHDLSEPFKMHTKVICIPQPCWYRCCECQVCDALEFSWRLEMQAANSMGKVRKGSAPTWETFCLSSRVVLSLTVLPTLLVVLLASLAPLPDPPPINLRTVLDSLLMHQSWQHQC